MCFGVLFCLCVFLYVAVRLLSVCVVVFVVCVVLSVVVCLSECLC